LRATRALLHERMQKAISDPSQQQHQGQVHNNVAGNYLAAPAGTLYILFAYRINGAASHELRHLCLMYCAVNEMQRSARRPRGLTTRIAARTPHLSRATRLSLCAPRDTETTTIERQPAF
jgi:hypothetical protein